MIRHMNESAHRAGESCGGGGHGRGCGSGRGRGRGMGHGHGHGCDHEHEGEGGAGRGRGHGGFGPGGVCICASCGKEIPHEEGKPCLGNYCPGCGRRMVRPELIARHGHRHQNAEKGETHGLDTQAKAEGAEPEQD